MSEWISVKERLPEYDLLVLIARYNSFSRDTRKCVVSLAKRTHTDHTGNHWRELTFDDSSIWVPPTHWMPLPEPPEVVEEGA